MTKHELTQEEKDKLDRLLAILATFAELDQLMDLPMMRVMTTVCRHEGERVIDLAPRLDGYAPAVVSRQLIDLGTENVGQGKEGLGVVDYRSPDPRTAYLTEKGAEIRERLLALMG